MHLSEHMGNKTDTYLIFVTMQCDTTNLKPLSLAHALENLVHLASVDTKSLQLGVSFLCHHF